MRVYTTATNAKDVEQCRKRGMGTVCSPTDPPHKDAVDLPLMVDNGAFRAWNKCVPFPEAAFLSLLSKVYAGAWRVSFVVLPDIVGHGLRSLRFSHGWMKRLGGGSVALAVQNGVAGQDVLDVFGDDFRWVSHVFVGGTPEWKWEYARYWVEFAAKHGKQCHIGQCGTVERMKHAMDLGASSCDSANFARNGSWELLDEFFSPRQTVIV